MPRLDTGQGNNQNVYCWCVSRTGVVNTGVTNMQEPILLSCGKKTIKLKMPVDVFFCLCVVVFFVIWQVQVGKWNSPKKI